jgi:hypothetical protein
MPNGKKKPQRQMSSEVVGYANDPKLLTDEFCLLTYEFYCRENTEIWGFAGGSPSESPFSVLFLPFQKFWEGGIKGGWVTNYNEP